MKAMILAAGMGTRLRPLTDHTPKPLIPVKGEPLIVHHLKALKKSGIQEVVINVAYQAPKIMDYLGNGEKYGLNIAFSVEENGPIGTAGGILKALPLLGDAPFICLSADIFSDFPIENLFHRSIKKAHLMMVENPAWHPKGDYGLENGWLNFSQPKFTYANFGLFSPSLFENCSPNVFGLSTLFEAAISNQEISGELFTGMWHNIGTVDDLHIVEAC